MQEAYNTVHEAAMRSDSTRTRAATFGDDSDVPSFSTCYRGVNRNHLEVECPLTNQRRRIGSGYCHDRRQNDLPDSFQILPEGNYQVPDYSVSGYRWKIWGRTTNAVNYRVHAEFVQ